MVIYLTENLVNGKKYIGKDSKNNPAYLGSGKYLLKAIKKYGRVNFQKTVLEYCESIEDLNSKEIYWIQKYNCVVDKMYYNMTDTITPCVAGRKDSLETRYRKSEAQKLSYKQGRKRNTGESLHRNRTPESYKLKESTKEKIAQKLKGKLKTDTHRKNMSIGRKGISTGPHSSETRAKISAKQVKRPIIKYDIDTLTEIKVYVGVSYVKEDGYNRFAVQNVLAGLAKTSGGFGWKYA